MARSLLLLVALMAVACVSQAHVCENPPTTKPYGKWLYHYSIKKWECHDYVHYRIKDIAKKDFVERAYHKAMDRIVAYYKKWEKTHDMPGECEPKKAWPVAACYQSVNPGKPGKQIKGSYGFSVKVEVECPYLPSTQYRHMDVRVFTMRDGSYWRDMEVWLEGVRVDP